MENAISVLGIVIVVAGLLVEFVAFAGMTCYPIRRALPFKSPLDLQACGCMMFFAGVVVLVIGQTIA